MLSSEQLLKRLNEAGVKRVRIAEVLDLDPTTVSQMFRGKRRLLLDEAKALTDAFQINEEEEDGASTLSVEVTRYLIFRCAAKLGVRLADDDPRVNTLAEEIALFSEFAASDTHVRVSLDKADQFFRVIDITRSMKISRDVDSS